jgi:dTDP-4-dehydrorhamnose reductase
MILLLGANGYIGQGFVRNLRAKGESYIPLSLEAFDYTRFALLFEYVRKMRPEFVINAPTDIDESDELLCHRVRPEAIQKNAILPQTVARVCLMTNTPLGHVSSGSIYRGAKVLRKGKMVADRDENGSWLAELFERRPKAVFGFTEEDEPNFSFRSPPCSFNSGTKALAEEALRGQERTYVWRFLAPFNEFDGPSNWLSQARRQTTLRASLTSVSHMDDCVAACLELRERGAPFGTYNVVNPGPVTTNQVQQLIQRILRTTARIHCLPDDEDFSRYYSSAKSSSCLLDDTRLLRAGVKLRRAQDAIEDALEKWQPAAQEPEFQTPAQEICDHAEVPVANGLHNAELAL